MGAADYRACRKRAGISIEKAAVACGCTAGTLYGYERGATSPTAETLKAMSDAYGCRIADLLGLRKTQAD